jgi:hypothetical protein
MRLDGRFHRPNDGRLMIFLLPVVFSAMTAGPPQEPPQPSNASGAVVEVPQKPVGSDTTADGREAEADELPVSLSRIQRALSRPPAIRLEGQRVVFRVEVLGQKLTIEDILGPDYLKGPVPSYGGMTHQEFLNMVTPKDVQGYAAFNNREAFTVAATSFALQWALQKAIHKFETAKQEREREAARKEVQEALADLEKARAKAGLPPK